MTATAHPQPSGEPAKARAAAALEHAYPDWTISISRGRFTARHRHEDYNARREQWGLVKTTVFADTPQQMRDRLDTQHELRRAEAPR
ncbi:hypothetical protein GCM10027570_48460 [Streptomonospora sediminis]